LDARNLQRLAAGVGHEIAFFFVVAVVTADGERTPPDGAPSRQDEVRN
jgi:hypothetical protein